MKLQKGLLLIPAVFGLGWGSIGLIAPGKLELLLGVPAESINPALISTQLTFAISQICLGIISLWIRSLDDQKIMSQAMKVVAAAFLLFGIELVLAPFVVAGATMNMVLFIQGIVFIILAGVFFSARNPK
ncbi:hypothetical protein ACFLRM_03090 [Acidobacteriota bacterium]